MVDNLIDMFNIIILFNIIFKWYQNFINYMEFY